MDSLMHVSALILLEAQMTKVTQNNTDTYTKESSQQSCVIRHQYWMQETHKKPVS